MPLTTAEALSKYNNQKVELAQRLGLRCRICGNTIKMFCCGETFPLSTMDLLKVQEEYGRVWCGDDVELSAGMTVACQALINLMNQEGVLSMKISAEGLVETER